MTEPSAERARPVRIRPFDPADGPACADLQTRAIAAISARVYGPEDRAAWADGVAAQRYADAVARGETFAVAVGETGTVLGFASALPGRVVNLFVAPEAQGAGIGRALLAWAEKAAAGDGATEIAVDAALSALPFYRSQGFREIGRARQETRGGRRIEIAKLVKPMEPARPWRNLYGRRLGKKLRPGQQDLLETRLRALAPSGVGWDENPERRPLDLAALFPGAREHWLEIGFGGGEHMIHQAQANPDIGLLGCEPYINGVAKLLAAIERAGVANLRLHPGDARDVLDVIPAGALSRVFLLYPDPWPKKRHWKRRFVSAETLDSLARAMRPGAAFRVATDIEDYVRHTLEQVDRDPRFAWAAARPDDWRRPWDDWPGTRYEAKALREGRRPHYLTFLRR